MAVINVMVNSFQITTIGSPSGLEEGMPGPVGIALAMR